MLNGFCLLIKKKTQSLFVTNDMKLDGIPKQNKKKRKIHTLLTMHFKFWSYFLYRKYNIEPPVIFFLIVLYEQVSTHIILHKYFQIIFVTYLPFLMDSLKPSIELSIFGRATLLSLAMSFAMFTTKENLNTIKKVLLLFT